MEMNPQEKEFLEMSKEFTGDCSESDVLQVTGIAHWSKFGGRASFKIKVLHLTH
jgi:hypothetical protein